MSRNEKNEGAGLLALSFFLFLCGFPGMHSPIIMIDFTSNYFAITCFIPCDLDAGLS